MKIGILKERMPAERRVAASPDSVKLVGLGYDVHVNPLVSPPPIPMKHSNMPVPSLKKQRNLVAPKLTYPKNSTSPLAP